MKVQSINQLSYAPRFQANNGNKIVHNFVKKNGVPNGLVITSASVLPLLSNLPIDEKLIIPADLAAVWQQSTVDGSPMATYIGDIVEGAPLDNSTPWFSPMMAAILIVLIALGFAFTKYPYWDWILLGMQVLVGSVLVFLWFVMREFGGSAYILMVLFNPLPLIFWRWRRYWALPYAIALLIGVAVLLCLPHMLVDPAILVLALAYIVLFAKDSVKRYNCKS